MPTIHVEAGLYFRVFNNDHGSPHVHVVKGKATVVIRLGDEKNKPTIHQKYDMKDGDCKKALKLVAEKQDAFLAAWRKYHAKA